MANVFSSNPVYLDTDTTVILNTNWRGSSGGSAFVGKVGLRPEKIIVIPLGATTAGAVIINEINSTGGGTGPILFKAWVPTSVSGLAAQEYDLVGTGAGWHDFIVTGVTATGVALEIYFRV
jgi:hypothetical protein